jgi:hypothetical protein
VPVTSPRRLALALTLTLAIAAATPAAAEVLVPDLPETGRASDADRAEARAAYDAAGAAYAAGELDAALEAADRAWKALPNSSTALVRATILADLKRDRDAFEAYLQAADLAPTAEESEMISAGLAKHGPRASPAMGWVVVRSTPAGADATLDGAPFRTPRTVGATGGKHELLVEASGYSAHAATLSVRAGRPTAAEARLLAVSDADEPPEVEEPEGPPPAKLRHQRLQLRPYFNIGFPGKAKLAESGIITTFDSIETKVRLSWGGGLYLDIPLRQVFALGIEIGFGTWTTQLHKDAGVGPNYNIDIGFVPRFRVPFGNIAEAYIAIPLGLTIGIENSVEGNEFGGFDKVTNNGAGIYLGLYLGGKVYVSDAVGIFIEGGWTPHFWMFPSTDPGTQWTTRHGAIRTGVAILF